MSSPRPTATGSLDSTPVINLLVYALDHALTGTLVLEEQPGSHKHAVYFDEGGPAKVKTAHSVCQLGPILVELGAITQAEADAALALVDGTESRLAEALTEGDVEESQLKAGLREQLTRQLGFLAQRPRDTLYGYYDRVNLLEHWGSPELIRGRPLEIIWRLIDETLTPGLASDMITRLGERELKLHVDAPIQRFHFSRSEQTVIEVLRAKPQPYLELLGRQLTEPDRLERLIYALALTRQLNLGVPGVVPVGLDEGPSSTRLPLSAYAGPGGFGAAEESLRSGTPFPGGSASGVSRGVSPAPLAPPAEAPEIAAFRREIQTRAAAETETLYEVLGLPSDVPPAEVQPAFLALAKKWHPDRLPPELASLRELASRVFSRMNEAGQVLTDALQRREYDSKLRRAGREIEEQEQVQRVLRAATSFQKAEVFLKRNNLAAAEIEAKQALADHPDSADHLALVAWLEAQKPDADPREALNGLNRALQIQPNNLRAHWYRGQIYKRLDKMHRAIRDFKFVVERDPRHVDALRELRLYMMRRGGRATSIPPSGGEGGRSSSAPSPSDKPKSEGLISKLFKR